MPVSGRPLRLLLALAGWALAVASAAPEAARAELTSSPLHHTGDRVLWHRKENRIELFGHAAVSQPGETLTADYISLDLAGRVLDAKGNCVYVTSGNVISGEEMHFNLDTRTGSIVGGRVSNDRFSLSGERINKLGEGRFQTHRGEYSTCRDCPNSWSLLVEDVDMQVEGYARMSGVTGKITDVPAFWLPYLIVPMKTRRQTGLLFPSFGFGGQNGFTFVLPFFWAINRSSDMTVGAGYYGNRGERVEWEGRYALSERSGGQARAFYVSDRSFADGKGTRLPKSRWALDVAQVQELPWGIEEKLRLTDVSDNEYPARIGDVPGAAELTMPSSLSFSWASSDLSAFAAARWYRTLVNTNPDPVLQKVQFDPRTVQAVPQVAVTANDRPLLGSPLVFGFTLGLTHFTRSRDAFDYDYTVVPFGQAAPTNAPPAFSEGATAEFPNVNPIRKATRVSFSPTVYTTFRPFDAFSFTPSARYYAYHYSFPQSPSSNFTPGSLNRDYLLLQFDLSTQLERVYEYPEEKDAPRVKHLIRPLVTYSYIPQRLVREDNNHPFQSQIRYAAAKGIPGYYFDDYDIVPIDASPATTNYFIPLGNTVALGVTTQWIRRDGALDAAAPSYTKYIEATAGEAINLRAYQTGSNQPLSRFFTTLDLNLGRFAYSHLYYYYPYIDGIRHSVYETVSFALERGLHQSLFNFDRSLSLSYSWDQHGLTDLTKGTNNLTASFSYSLSDYLLPSAYSSFTFLPGQRLLNAGLSLAFQHPSRCWKVTVNLPYRSDIGTTYNFDLALNLTGSGFGGVTEVATQSGALR